MRTVVEERFWQKVNKTDTCWLWTAATNGRQGYGVFGRKHGDMVLAHRLVYEPTVGPIPDGLQIDHLCRVRLCVNPAHLEPVTARENVARSASSWQPWQSAGQAASAANRRQKTHCKRGHEFTPENTRLVPGGRNCRACAVIHTQRYRQREANRVA